jgi:mono/diheme cytochrome c family protein
MKFLVGLGALLAVGLVFASCQSNPAAAPPVTQAFIRAGLRANANGETLAEGRRLFLNRCILCHALPEISRYDQERLPGIVGWMSDRAHLSREQQDAVAKYLVTARSQ